jgi:hypothetical protein
MFEKPNKFNLPDLCFAEITLPPSVTILAPGPKGETFWDQIDGYVIAVNRAVKIPIKINDWIVADGNAASTDWFKWGLRNFKGKKLFSEAIHRQIDEHGDYTFWMVPFFEKEIIIHREKFRPSESVTGIAIDYAVRYGSRHIKLVGVDMEGGYFDDKSGNFYTENNLFLWSLLNLINHFKSIGVKIESISPTKLQI